MFLKSYFREIFRPECNPSFESLHCIAHLDQDISEVLPYLNAVLGGFEYVNDPPAVIFRSQSKFITVHGRKIAINALKDEAEADKILEWLKREINEAWETRDNIEPSYGGMPKPKVIEILKLLLKTNCHYRAATKFNPRFEAPQRRCQRNNTNKYYHARNKKKPEPFAYNIKHLPFLGEG